MFWFFAPSPCGILPSQPGIEPTASALEGEVLTTGAPWKSFIKDFPHPGIELASLSFQQATVNCPRLLPWWLRW